MGSSLRTSGRFLLFSGLAALALALAPGAAPRIRTAADLITYSCTPAPANCTGWYTTNVTIRWTVDPTAIETEGCRWDTVTTDTPGKLEPCAAKNVDGVWTRVELTIKVDKTAPAVTGGTPDRPPDANGWYNHPLSVAFQGADPTSGVAACTIASYQGPDSGAAAVDGACRDNAGNTSPPRQYVFKYDTTHPTLSTSAVSSNRVVLVRWRVSPDTRQVAIDRALANAAGRQARRVYHGAGTRFRDEKVRNGVTYVYIIRAIDHAGLVSSAKLRAVPTPLFAPRRGARVAQPPLLHWTSVRRATYYNVQLRRNGRKILSTWPRRPLLQLRWSWTFQGRRYRLSPGRYRWYVWPGFGDPAAVAYGSLLGQNEFIVRT